VDVKDRNHHLPRLLYHLLARYLVRRNIYVLKGDTLLLEELFRPLAVRSSRCRVKNNLGFGSSIHLSPPNHFSLSIEPHSLIVNARSLNTAEWLIPS
jgi:hypothetical protein